DVNISEPTAMISASAIRVPVYADLALRLRGEPATMLLMGRTRETAAVLLAIFSIAVPGYACSVVYVTQTVGPNFRVQVMGPGQSIPGLHVGLQNGRGITQVQAATNQDGVARFQNVAPGPYFLSVDHNASVSGIESIEVIRRASSEVLLPLRV